MNELVDYILKARTAGESDDEIIASLVVQGWTTDQIGSALHDANGANTVASDVVSDSAYQGFLTEHEEPSQIDMPVTNYESSQASAEPLPTLTHTFDSLPTSSSSKKPVVVLALAIIIIAGSGVAIWTMGNSKNQLTSKATSTPTVETQKVANEKSKADSPAFIRDYPIIGKGKEIELADSLSFSISGIQRMGAKEFRELEQGVQVSDLNEVVLVYYTVNNKSDGIVSVYDVDESKNPFIIVDETGSRIDIVSSAFTDSLVQLSELKPGQYTSNALVFQIPKQDEDKLVYMLVDFNPERTFKGYMQL